MLAVLPGAGGVCVDGHELHQLNRMWGYRVVLGCFLPRTDTTTITRTFKIDFITFLRTSFLALEN